MIRKILLFVLFNFLVSINADGPGPIFAKNLEWSRFSGKWYLNKKGPNIDPAEVRKYECAEETYTINPKNKFVLDYTVSYKEKNIAQPKTEQGWVTYDEKSPARATFYIENKAISANLIATDYTKWALATTMGKSFSNVNVRIFWILSRTPVLDVQSIDVIESFIEAFGGNKKDMVSYSNVNCPNSPRNSLIGKYDGLPGGLSKDEKTPTPELKELIKKLNPTIKQKINDVQGRPIKEVKSGLELFEPLTFKTQIVAGRNYFVKVKINGENGDQIWHLKIHEPLGGNPAQLIKVSGPKLISHPLEYFD